jgi:hypothetical protein
MSVIAFLLALAALLVGCGHSPSPQADPAAQITFATPEEAGRALQKASKDYDEGALAGILGPHSKAILRSGDAVEDRASLDSFVAKYDRMNRWAGMTDGSQLLYIGADNYPFPIPLVQNSASRWYFHAKAARNELLVRRIGQNELLAIDACNSLANAEELYFKTAHDGNPAHQYTTRIISSPGKQDGLYWKVSPGQPASPLGRVDEFAKDAVDAASSGGPTEFDGYVFRILTSQGEKAKGGARSYMSSDKLVRGFAVLAAPAKYGNSGIMTFILDREGVVYQRDLGADKETVTSIDTYNPDPTWEPAE